MDVCLVGMDSDCIQHVNEIPLLHVHHASAPLHLDAPDLAAVDRYCAVAETPYARHVRVNKIM